MVRVLPASWGNEAFVRAVLVDERGTWLNVIDVCHRVAAPTIVDTHDVVVTWLDEPTGLVSYVVIVFSPTLWSTAALYKHWRIDDEAEDPQALAADSIIALEDGLPGG